MKKKIRKAQSKASAQQGTYYHKTGPVPKHVHQMTKKELTKAASASAGNRKSSHMKLFKKAIVKHAVQAVHKKFAELHHKKAVAARLKQKKGAKPARVSRKAMRVLSRPQRA